METDPAFMDAYDDDGFAAAAGEQYGSLHRRQQEQMLQHYQQLARQREAAAAAPPIRQRAAAAAAGDAAAGVDDDEAAAAEAAADAADAAAAAAAVTGVAVEDDEAPLDLPEGINLEEARMLEAAMLGIPYQGRMPDFSNAAAAAAGPPLSPGAMEQRSLRAEQDAAYEESLALDRCAALTLGLCLGCVVRKFHPKVRPKVWLYAAALLVLHLLRLRIKHGHP